MTKSTTHQAGPACLKPATCQRLQMEGDPGWRALGSRPLFSPLCNLLVLPPSQQLFPEHPFWTESSGQQNNETDGCSFLLGGSTHFLCVFATSVTRIEVSNWDPVTTGRAGLEQEICTLSDSFLPWKTCKTIPVASTSENQQETQNKQPRHIYPANFKF